MTDERLARHRTATGLHGIFNSPVLREVSARTDLPKPFLYVSGTVSAGLSGWRPSLPLSMAFRS